MGPSPPDRKAIDDADLDQFEANTHPFVVKIWLEETAKEAGQATWRGHITHVPSGERRYLRDLGEIEAFITPYLERMGVRVRRHSGMGRFLERVRIGLSRALGPW
jgi:hypothetical protein